jgi:hypothetical protein
MYVTHALGIIWHPCAQHRPLIYGVPDGIRTRVTAVKGLLALLAHGAQLGLRRAGVDPPREAHHRARFTIIWATARSSTAVPTDLKRMIS